MTKYFHQLNLTQFPNSKPSLFPLCTSHFLPLNLKPDETKLYNLGDEHLYILSCIFNKIYIAEYQVLEKIDTPTYNKKYAQFYYNFWKTMPIIKFLGRGSWMESGIIWWVQEWRNCVSSHCWWSKYNRYTLITFYGKTENLGKNLPLNSNWQ